MGWEIPSLSSIALTIRYVPRASPFPSVVEFDGSDITITTSQPPSNVISQPLTLFILLHLTSSEETTLPISTLGYPAPPAQKEASLLLAQHSITTCSGMQHNYPTCHSRKPTRHTQPRQCGCKEGENIVSSSLSRVKHVCQCPFIACEGPA